MKSKKLRRLRKKKSKTIKKRHHKTKRLLKKIKHLRINREKIGGDDTDKVNCCMCGKEINRSGSLMPLKCEPPKGKGKHRICYACWWDEKTGFALEGPRHECPGCTKGLPYPDAITTAVFDFTGDSDED